MKLSVIIPCYNEVLNVESLCESLIPCIHKLLVSGSLQPDRISSIEVIFVDDGSNDGTLSELHKTFGQVRLQDSEFVFKRHESNRGLGAALRTGFLASTGDVIVTTDSDGTYKYSEMLPLLDTLTPGVDIVTASPYHPLGHVVGVPGYRLILSQGSSFLYRILVDWRIHTYTSLFRAYRRSVITTLTFNSNGFLAGTELLVKAMFKGFHVAEYPATLYRRAYGVSKAKLLRTIIAHLRFQTQVLGRRLGFDSL